MKNLSGINNGDFSHLKRENKIIVSLTSYRERFKKLPITIYSLLNQTLKPDKIILWIDNETEDLTTIPYEITRFIKNGLEIRFVKDIKSYTKAIYAFKEYTDSIIVTADDDIYYRKNWL
ncbi:MAG: glycosyltransferase family 2 protein, partial [bacterium]|nr:glycosyltransferase family 2 protein [bacterium]